MGLVGMEDVYLYWISLVDHGLGGFDSGLRESWSC